VKTCLFEDDVIEYFNKYWLEHCDTDRLLFDEKYHKLHNVRRLHPYSTHKEFFDKIFFSKFNETKNRIFFIKKFCTRPYKSVVTK